MLDIKLDIKRVWFMVILAAVFMTASCSHFKTIAEGETMETVTQKYDYDRIAQILKVSAEEPYYDAYVDYMCYLKGQYPVRAALKEIREEKGCLEVRVWEHADYTMSAKWKSKDGKQECTYEWEWKNQDTENTVKELIEDACQRIQTEPDIDETSERTYAEASLQKMERSVKGNIYERTPNNFVKGVDLDLSEESLESLKEIAASVIFSESVTEAEGEVKYRIRLYDADGNLVLDFGIYENDQVWCQRKQIKNPDSLLVWLGQMTGR